MADLYVPSNSGWTEADKETLKSWIGKKVYVDEGDSIGCSEFIGTLEEVTTQTFRVRIQKDWAVTFDTENIPHVGLHKYD